MCSSTIEQARMAYDQGLWGSAIDNYAQALAADPLDAEACRGLADAHAICGNLNTVVESYLQLMDILCHGDNFTAALQVGEWVKCIRPESDAVRAKNVGIFLRLGDTVRVVQQSMELARLYVELGQGESAISLLIEAQKADPLNLDIGLELAETYVSQGLMQDGARQFGAMGRALVESGQLERACEAFRRLKLIGTDSGVLLTLGNIYVQLGRFNEAEQEYRSALRQNLNDEGALFALGSVCQLKGQWRDAILAFNRILTLNPDVVEAQERLGELFQQQSMQGEAVKHYLLAAQGRFEAGEREQAVRLYQVVLGLDPVNPVAVRELGVMDAPLVGLVPELPEVELPRAEVVEPRPSGLPRVGLVRTAETGVKSSFLGKRRLGQGTPAPALVGKQALAKPVLLRKAVAEEPVVVVVEPLLQLETTESGRLRRPAVAAASGPLLPPPIELLDEISVSLLAEAEPVDVSAGSSPTPLELLDGVGAFPLVIGEADLDQAPSWLEMESSDSLGQPISDEAPSWLEVESSDSLDQPVSGVAWAGPESFEELVSQLESVEGSCLLDEISPMVAAEHHETALFTPGAEMVAEPSVEVLTVFEDWLPPFDEQPTPVSACIEDGLFAGLGDLHSEVASLGCSSSALPEESPMVESEVAWLSELVSPNQDGDLVLIQEGSFDGTVPSEQSSLLDEVPAWLEESPVVDLGSLEAEMPADQVELARSVREAGRLADVPGAIQAYRESMELHPDNLVLRTYLADLHLDYGMLDDAVVQYRQVLKRAPQSVVLHHRLVQSQLWNDHFEDAASTLLSLSELHLSRDERAEALDAVQSALSLDPHHLGARRALVALSEGTELALHHLEQLAESALAVGSLEVAAEALSRLTISSDFAGYQERLAQVLEARGESAEALLHYRQLATRYTAAGDWTRAAAVLGRAGAELRAEVMSGLRCGADATLANGFQYGTLCFHLGELDSAIEQFQQTRRDPALLLPSLNLLALCFAEKSGFNMTELAIRQFRKGLETPGYAEHEYAELRYNLAMLLERLGRRCEALSELRLCPVTFRDCAEWVGRWEGC